MTSWELAVRLRQISRMIPFAPKISGALRYLDIATMMYSLDLDDVQTELIKHLENEGQIDPRISSEILEILAVPQSSLELELKEKIPKGIRNLLVLDNLRPSTVYQLYHGLEIETIQELKSALRTNRISNHKGLGKRFASQLQHQLTLFQKGSSSLFLYKADSLANLITRKIISTDLVNDIHIVGDVRRGKEDINTIDILCVCENPSSQLSTELMKITNFENSGLTNSGFSGLCESILIKVHFCKEKYLGSALVCFTGPSEHYSKLARRVLHAKKVRAGFLKISGDEETFYKKLELSYIPPEVREWSDAIDITENGEKWELIKREDIKGDLHVHTTWSDGRSGFSELANTAKNLGHEYIAITDHAEGIGNIKGLSLVSLKKQIEIIRKMNSGKVDFEFIPGIELNINRIGEVDYKFQESVLKLGAIHYDMGQNSRELMSRYLNAIESGNINILAHISGRKLKVREEFDLDWKKLFSVCEKHNVAIELNYSPDRMDVRWKLARMADKEGCKFSIAGDIHYAFQMNNIRFGLMMARRAGLSSKKVLNCYSSRDIRMLMWNKK